MRLDFVALTLDCVVMTAFNVENSNYWLFGENRRYLCVHTQYGIMCLARRTLYTLSILHVGGMVSHHPCHYYLVQCVHAVYTVFSSASVRRKGVQVCVQSL